ncbi:hypothetical protein ACTXT7_008262 [Hymenolepis weldensis]
MDALMGWYIFAKGEPLKFPESNYSDRMGRGPLSLVRTPCVAVETTQIYLRNRRLGIALILPPVHILNAVIQRVVLMSIELEENVPFVSNS